MLTAGTRLHDRVHFFKYCKLATADRVLRTGRLRWSSPLLFNDPFDYARVLSFSFTSEELVDALIDELKVMLAKGVRPSGVMQPSISTLLDKMRASGDRLEATMLRFREVLAAQDLMKMTNYKGMQEAWDLYLPYMRILCVSETNTSGPMWAHYAESYKGAVLQLECVDAVDSPLLAAKQVIYSDESPVIGTLRQFILQLTGQEAFDYEKQFGRLELIKKLEWRYEQEWRVISNDKGSLELYTDYEMHPLTFSKVFLGPYVAPEAKRAFRELPRGDLAHLEIYESEVNQVSRDIDFVRIK
jgi:hypothetical protein